MDSVFPRDAPPRSRPSLRAVIQEKLRGADLVAVGVNIVVGALLIGGVIGAMATKDSQGTPPTDLNAALAAQSEPGANETAPSPAPGADEASGDGDDEEERESDK